MKFANRLSGPAFSRCLSRGVIQRNTFSFGPSSKERRTFCKPSNTQKKNHQPSWFLSLPQKAKHFRAFCVFSKVMFLLVSDASSVQSIPPPFCFCFAFTSHFLPITPLSRIQEIPGYPDDSDNHDGISVYNIELYFSKLLC